jgi:hypothetical protein
VLAVYDPDELAFGKPADVDVAASGSINARVRAAMDLPPAAQNDDVSDAEDDAPLSTQDDANDAQTAAQRARQPISVDEQDVTDDEVPQGDAPPQDEGPDGEDGGLF